MELYRNSISSDMTHRINGVYRCSDNQYLGNDRHYPSSIGHFLLSKFTNEEMNFVWSELLENENSFAKDYEPVFYRVLKYTTGCFIGPHVDVAKTADETDYTLVIQMNPANEFEGGVPIVEDKEYHLEQGDAIIYKFGETHSVSEVTKGTRYVLIVRMNKKHK